MKRLLPLLFTLPLLASCGGINVNTPAAQAQAAISTGLTALNDSGTVAIAIVNEVAALHSACQPAPGVCLVSDSQFASFSKEFEAVRDKVDAVVVAAQSASATVGSVQAAIHAVIDEVTAWIKSLGSVTSPTLASNEKSLNSKLVAVKATVGGK